MLIQLQQQLQIFGEQLLVVLQIISEQREGLDKSPASVNNFRPSAGQQIQCREVLEDPHRVSGAEHSGRTGQFDPFGHLGNRSKHNRHRRDDKVQPVMLPDTKDVEAGFIRKLGCRNDLLQPLLRADPLPGMAVCHQVAQCIDAELKCRSSFRLHMINSSHK
ncbi:hypothetical protein D3C80_1193130 [compost metagenome]